MQIDASTKLSTQPGQGIIQRHNDRPIAFHLGIAPRGHGVPRRITLGIGVKTCHHAVEQVCAVRWRKAQYLGLKGFQGHGHMNTDGWE